MTFAGSRVRRKAAPTSETGVMVNEQAKPDSASVIRGEFFSDGATFVMRLADTPISGIGQSPAQAYDDLLRASAAAGDLPARLAHLAKEQRGEQVRAAVIRTTMTALIAFGVVGGAIAGAVTVAPAVIADIVQASAGKLAAWAETMPPETEEKLKQAIKQFKQTVTV